MRQSIRRLKGFDPEWFHATVHKLQKGHIKVGHYLDVFEDNPVYYMALVKYFECQWPDTTVCMHFRLSPSTLLRCKRKLFEAIWKDYQNNMDRW